MAKGPTKEEIGKTALNIERHLAAERKRFARLKGKIAKRLAARVEADLERAAKVFRRAHKQMG